MQTTTLQTDYLIIGSGAVGMAFADTLLTETTANIIIVDKHHKPGGHWNDAYSFVTLHQPSAFYGVSSLELASGRKDQRGLNQGLMELASGAQVLSYFDDVMRQRFLPSGRVQYFPMCEYLGNGEFKALLSNKRYQVEVSQKTVDATHFKTSVPATHTRNYSNDHNVDVRPLNALPMLEREFDHYVVVGGGKTGIDACLWMLEHQIAPENISWVMPRDAWWVDRANTQPAREYFAATFGAQLQQTQAIAEATSLADLFNRLEQAGCLLRLDSSVEPTMYHGATVSRSEVKELRRIRNILRQGRVKHIEQGKLHFDSTTVSVPNDSLFIDCSARAVPVQDIKPVFAKDQITVQTVRTIQPVFSASFIAHVEAEYDDEKIKNELCRVVPLPNHASDWLVATAAQMQNQYRWSQESGLREWLINNRLDGFTRLTVPDEQTSQEELAILLKLKEAVPAAVANLPNLMAELHSKTH